MEPLASSISIAMREKSNLLQNEEWENSHLFDPVSSFSDRYFKIERPSRFNLPISITERLKILFFKLEKTLDFFKINDFFFLSPRKNSISYSWQILLRFLTLKGVLTTYWIMSGNLRNDFPNSYFFNFSSDPNDYFDRTDLKKITGWGNSTKKDIAISKAVGELLERFFLAHGKKEYVSSVSLLKMKNKRFLHPKKVSQFHREQEKQFPRFQYNENSIFSWVEGKILFSNKKILLPAQSVFRGYQFDEKEPILRDPNSNGCAGHFTLQEALLAAIYETVERDGFLVYWLNNISPTRLDPKSFKKKELTEYIEKLKRYQFEVHFLNTTTDIGIPSFLCVLIDRSEKGPKVAVGGGSGFDIEGALLSAALEASSVHNVFSNQNTFELQEEYKIFSDKKIGRDERILLWQNPLMFPKFAPFLSGPVRSIDEIFPPVNFSSIEEEYTYVTNIFKKLGDGYELYYHEVKSPVLTKIGYHVVKVIIPELLHLYLNEAFPPLGAKRLKEVPLKLGYTPTEKWNPWPHPFP